MSKKKTKILVVTEGPKAEGQILRNMTKYFIEDIVVHCAYCKSVYQLYTKIMADRDLSTLGLLKENPINKKVLSAFKKKDFAQIYLFFDYDGHDHSAGDYKIKKLLRLFDNETDKGKLFISYPMVEALKHYSRMIGFKDLKVKIKPSAETKKYPSYKDMVDKEVDGKLKNLTAYTKANWIELIEIHLKKDEFYSE